MPTPRIALITYHNDAVHEGASYREVGELTLPSKRAYCERHGYDLIVRDQFDYARTVPGYERIDLFLEHMPRYDWQLYLEADSMVMNPARRVEDMVAESGSADLVIARNAKVTSHIEVNNGTMLVRSSDWSRAFLQWTHQPHYHQHPWVSQQAIGDALNHMPGQVAGHIRLVDWRYFNSVWHSAYPEHNWRPGDFALHAAGAGNGWRKRLFTELAPAVAAGLTTDPSFAIQTPPCR